MQSERNLEIVQKVKDNIYCAVENVKGASAVWQKFLVIKETESGKNVGFAQCRMCQKIMMCNSKSGTSNLTRHVCKIDVVPVRTDISISSEDKKEILEGCVTYCTQDLRSFNSISGPGFKKLAQKLVHFGCKYGRVPVENALPHATTVSRNVLEMAEVMRKTVLPEIMDAVRQGICAATTDLWTDQYTKTSYYTVTAHYINKSWGLVTRVLFTTDFPDEKKTGENIRRELNRRFEEFGIPLDMIHKITFVTDQGSNIIKALETVERLNCSKTSSFQNTLQIYCKL